MNRFAVCLKATSKLDGYKDRPERMAGVVLVPAGTHSFFPLETIIQPDNQVPIPYLTLATQHATGEFEILGAMYGGFVADLVKAVKASHTMSPERQRSILSLLGFPGP